MSNKENQGNRINKKPEINLEVLNQIKYRYPRVRTGIESINNWGNPFFENANEKDGYRLYKGEISVGDSFKYDSYRFRKDYVEYITITDVKKYENNDILYTFKVNNDFNNDRNDDIMKSERESTREYEWRVYKKSETKRLRTMNSSNTHLQNKTGGRRTRKTRLQKRKIKTRSRKE